MLNQFSARSYKLERIDTGDYTAEEYDQFLKDIRLVNRITGDNRALSKSLFRDITHKNLREFSVLDVGAGSGELLRSCARFSRKNNRRAALFGLELNRRSAESILVESKDFNELASICGDALRLPFEDNSFDYVVCSLFTHHFREAEIIRILKGISRLAKRKIFIIDLHRHPAAFSFYKLFCAAFSISPLVREDGSLSIKRGFKPSELENIAVQAGLDSPIVKRSFPFRLILTANGVKNAV